MVLAFWLCLPSFLIRQKYLISWLFYSSSLLLTNIEMKLRSLISLRKLKSDFEIAIHHECFKVCIYGLDKYWCLKAYYSTYESALKLLKLETLKTRREKLCKSFAQKCTRNVKVKSMFPKSTCQRQVRNQNKYFVNFATTERYLKSSIPFMQRMLNSEHKQKSKLIRCRGS